jgi:pimeloyl-ACP methyl ester carboxylesterase
MATEARVEDRIIELNGLRFHYRDWGDPSAPPLVLLHGFTGHARSWDTFASAMQDRYRVLALDQRGHGESEWAPDYHAERMVEDLHAFADALKLGRFALLGLSMGGRNAYLYAAQYPETVERLVIVDIGPDMMREGAERIRRMAQARDVWDDPEDAVRDARAVNPRPPDDELRHRVLHGLVQRPDGRWTLRYDASLRSPETPLPRPDPAYVWAQLPKITCPTLIVRGAESDVLSRETAERMAKTIPTCTLVEVPRSGHTVPLDNPKGFLEAVDAFLQP